MKISDFMKPARRVAKEPRHLTSYRAARRNIAKIAYRAAKKNK